MQRHGWAFCLGVLAIGSAMAQPPADLERYPPAPDLPGVVVGKSESTILTADKSDKSAPSGELPFEPIQQPKDKPATNESRPAEPIALPATTLPAPTTAVGGPVCKPSCGSTGCCDKVVAWLLHRSRAKQRGHYVTPYTPPLHAWFPCKPSAGCANGKCPMGTVTVVPMVIPPTNVTPLPPPAVAPKAPVATLPKPQEHVPSPEPASELLPGLNKGVDVGIRFTPGIAPMAKPTTQTEKVSNWRPK